MERSAAVIGLGNLGHAWASRVLGTRPLLLVEPDASRRADFADAGDTVAMATLPAAGAADSSHWAQVERVHVLVRTTDQAMTVLAQLEQLVGSGTPVHLHTTLSAAGASALADRATALRVLEQPVTGGAAGIHDGRFAVLTAGPATDEDHAWLADLGARVIPFAAYGDPTAAKLVNNVLAACTTGATAALLLLARELGIDLTQMREVLRHGSGGSWMAEALPDLQDDQVQLLVKDVGLLAELAGRVPSVDPADGAALLRDVSAARAAMLATPGTRP
ncbi:NAD-binding protein [Nocardioides dongkuii]|uniref:NAD-binding protein n=1 Tax=Nocardioides dongkuii TaxID=2760089 RepID=UPI0015FC9881|nr:NAD-binding protein [Nocardioides dongkuii]